jgi:hypothetical protein
MAALEAIAAAKIRFSAAQGSRRDMNTNKLFERLAANVWPVVRLMVKRSRRCSRCILSDRHGPLIDGVCAECREMSAHAAAPSRFECPPEMKRDYDQVIRSHIDDRPYHAALLLSGGKDSAYMLARLRDDYPQLRLLSIVVNNGFMSPTAIAGARHVSEKLQVDLLIVNERIAEFQHTLRAAFLDLNGRGSYGVIDHADGSMIFKTGMDVAAEMGIPLVLGGLSWVQVQRILGKDDFQQRDPGKPLTVFPLAVWRTGEQEIRAIVRDRGLLPKGSDSPLVSNSTLILAMSIIDVLNIGYSSFEPEFAQLVREGKSDRKNWLYLFEMLEFATRRGLLAKDLNETLGRLQLSLADVIRTNR